jgi:hypothetical protein
MIISYVERAAVSFDRVKDTKLPSFWINLLVWKHGAEVFENVALRRLRTWRLGV